MNKNFLIELTNNLYRLTLLFPKKEPLRYKMRELADDILADSLRITNFYEYTNKSDPSKKCNEERARYIEDVEEELEILDSYFEVAKAQNWVSSSEILAIQKEYANLREELKKIEPERKQEGQPQQFSSQTMLERQEKILAFLRENGRVQVRQVKQIFPEVSKRTLRRDFEHMLNQGIVERIGERNNTFYQLKDRTEIGHLP